MLRQIFLLVAFFYSLGILSARADFLIKPYLFSILGEKIGVAWSYSSDAQPTSSSLQLFKNENLVAYLAPQKDQELNSVILPISPCDFGTDLSYQVSEMAQPAKIEGIPCAKSEGTVGFSFLSDSQEGPQFVQQFAGIISKFPGSIVLHGGDLVQTGTSFDDWVDYFKAMESVGGNRVLFPSVGNHEYRYDSAVPAWTHYFRTSAKEAHYSFYLGPVQIIALNSNLSDDPAQEDLQLEWLETQLKIPSPWKVIYFHHPPYSSGIAHNFLAPKKEHIYIQDHFVPLFELYHVDLVLNGHVHLYERSVKNSVNYVTMGAAGGKIGWRGGYDPYLVMSQYTRTIANIQADEHTLQLVAVDMEGRAVDALFLSK